MKSIGFRATGQGTPAQALTDIQIDRPTASGRNILVRVDAISVNPVDTKMRARSTETGGGYQLLGCCAAVAGPLRRPPLTPTGA